MRRRAYDETISNKRRTPTLGSSLGNQNNISVDLGPLCAEIINTTNQYKSDTGAYGA